MSVPYTFQNTPLGSKIPLSELDANFTYVENQVSSLIANLPLQIVTNVSALRSISPSTSFNVQTEGYYTNGDGGGGQFYGVTTGGPYTDNGGTIITTGLGVTASSAWIRFSSENVNIRWFGAKGDGTSDDTVAFQNAAAYVDVNNRALYIPSGQYIISSQILFQKPPVILGEYYSPPVYYTFAGIPYEKKGSLIISKVLGDYAIKILPPNSDPYIRGLNIKNLHILADTSNTTGSGIAIINCGWDGYTENLVVEGFAGQGVLISQLQDSLFEQLCIINCGTDNLYPGLYITDGSNLLTFIRPHFEQNAFTLQIDNSFGINFYGGHFEAGLLSNPPYGQVPRYSSIRSIGANQIKFIGCIFAAPTLQATIAKYSITAAQCPYYIFVNGGQDVIFNTCSIGTGSNATNAKLLSLTCDGSVCNCYFYNSCVEDYPIYLYGNILFDNNSVSLNDFSNTSTAMCGINAQGASIRGNSITALNSSSVTKTSGSIFFSNSAYRAQLGQNLLYIAKYFQVHNGQPNQLTFNQRGFNSADFRGAVDAQLYDPDLTWAPNTAGTLTAINNAMPNQQIRIFNPNIGSFTVTSGGGIYLKGGVNAVIPQDGYLQLQLNPFNGVLVEMFRNF